MIWRVLTVSMAGLAGTSAAAADVSFSRLFNGAELGRSVVIQVADGDVLVFDGGTHILDGRDLVIFAARAEIRATTEVRSFGGTSAPPTVAGTPSSPPTASGQLDCGGRDGCRGVPGLPAAAGATGNAGAPSGRFVVEIGYFSASPGARLTLSAIGQRGGRGQQGARGGRGAEGGTGANAGEIPRCETPGRGGTGGPGGRRGAGGQGGRGGDGGVVLATAQTIQFAQAQPTALVLDVNGGPGGEAGELGERGPGGVGGARGAGSRTCSHDPPPPAEDGPMGPADADPTPPPLSGNPGRVDPIP